MVRAPCCERMGLKRGPWTPEEDQILISHIREHGHPNWRALPKLAGLERCGKSCRLRWTNYLRPDIKRGNFTHHEEQTIINLHQMLGNRWSAIAARLPGRTDNEIKNVWHTHLKKRLFINPPTPTSDGHHPQTQSSSGNSTTTTSTTATSDLHHDHQDQQKLEKKRKPRACTTISSSSSSCDDDIDHISPTTSPSSLPPQQSSSEFSSSSSSTLTKSHSSSSIEQTFFSNIESNDDSMEFWVKVLMETGGLPEDISMF